MAFSAVLAALRGALRETGLQESPQAQDSPQGFTRRHRGYRVSLEQVSNTELYSDRSRASLRYRLVLLVSHRLRPTPEDGFADLAQAGTDYERVVQALMGDQEINSLGDLHIDGFSPQVSASGEWLEAPVSFTVDVELTWLLDGGLESGS